MLREIPRNGTHWPAFQSALSWRLTREETMPRSIALFALLLGGILAPAAGPAVAADRGAWQHQTHGTVLVVPAGKLLPFPRSERSRAIWASGACWSGCQSYCTWGEAACLDRDAQGRCLKVTDHCDRICQRECRTQGGPLLPDIFDF
jgi:hypothetical protein